MTKVAKKSFTCSLLVKLAMDDKSPPTAKDGGGCMASSSLWCEPSGDLDIAPPTENGCCGMVTCVEFACNINCISSGVSVQPIANILEDLSLKCCSVIFVIQVRITFKDSITKKVSHVHKPYCSVG